MEQSINSLWGKKGMNGEPTWLPLIMHLADTAEIGKLLWDEWLCDGAKCNIANHCYYNGTPSESEKLQQARALFIFLCAAHDLGKATPAFQTKGAKVSHYGLECESDFPERQDACKRLDDMIAHAQHELGLSCQSDLIDRSRTPHALCSQVILQRLYSGSTKHAKNIAAILGAHHGKPQDSLEKDLDESYAYNFYNGISGKSKWQSVQKALAEWAIGTTGIFSKFEALPCPSQTASVELTGLLIMADWISSNESLCPYMIYGMPFTKEMSVKRASCAWKNLGLTIKWSPLRDLSFANSVIDYYTNRFDITVPNTMQEKIIDIARTQKDGGILVVEAPMGYGKTEAALSAAEILAFKSKRTGIFFALPTQATSNGIFPRLRDWVSVLNDHSHSIHLFHSKAEFNEEWTALNESFIDDESPETSETQTLIVNQWFSGRKKTMLADFVVGTIDQLLMGALKQKHFMLRHLGLTNKVVIIDECHAYDAYMSNYLERILSWLGIYHIPVIVLSATLPVEKRKTLIDAYRHTRYALDEDETIIPEWMSTRAYPLITSAEIGSSLPVCFPITITSPKTDILLEHIGDDERIDIISKIHKTGGCIGIIMNTVSRAQTFAQECRKIFGNDAVLLFHSRFTSPDRARIEAQLTRWLGKPSPKTERPEFKIIIGTQVLEQSLDIDFDVMITDIAPMDLLLQRMGRLHRHNRSRPKGVEMPVCYILDKRAEKFERGASVIYGTCLLMRTQSLLPDKITLPDDISPLVQDTYNFDFNPCGDIPEYTEAKKQYDQRISNKRARAQTYCISDPQKGKLSSVLGMLKTAANASAGEEAVRDLENTLEVIVIQRCSDGYIHILDNEMTPVAREETPSNDLAWEISKYRVSLPMNLCGEANGQRERTISALEQSSNTVFTWLKARYLKGELFLILDENGENHDIDGFVISYTKENGLSVLKHQEGNGDEI